MIMERTEIKCEYLTKGQCSSVLNSDEGKSARKDFCENKEKGACCYLCSLFYACEIGCDYLGKKCSLCGSDLRYAKMDLRVGGWEGKTKAILGSGLGEIGEFSEKKLPVIIYVCSKCNKLEFFADEKTKKRFWTEE
jgi:hypothetical protein